MTAATLLTPPPPFLIEAAPLLDNDNRSQTRTAGNHRGDDQQSFFASLAHPPRKLNGLEKILIGLSIALLVLASTFIGLFAGAESQLKNEKGKHVSVTATVTATKTAGMATTTVSTAPTGKPTQVSFWTRPFAVPS